MANNQNLKDAIAAVIKTNGNNEITGAILQSSLFSIINQFGAGAVFAGVAEPSTVPINNDVVAFYIATTNGIYPNFGGYSLTNNDFVIFSNREGVYEVVGELPMQDLSGLATKQEILPLKEAVKLTTPESENLSDNENYIQSGSYNLSGLYTDSQNWISLKKQPVRDWGEQTASGYGGVGGGSITIIFWDNDGNVLTDALIISPGAAVTTPITFTPPPEAAEWAINLRSGSGVGADPQNSPYINSFMLNVGSEALPFQPFVGVKIDKSSIDFDFDNIPSAGQVDEISQDVDSLENKINPLFIESSNKANGALMQNRQLSSSGNFASISNSWISLPFEPYEPGIYTISGHDGFGTSGTVAVVKDPNGDVVDVIVGRGNVDKNPYQFTVPDVNHTVAMNVASGTNVWDNVDFFRNSFMVNKGSEPLPFEPYGEKFDTSVLSNAGSGQIIYVSPTGDDENSGMSESLAVKTLQKAKEILPIGGEVILLEGDYKSPQFDLSDFSVIKAKTGARVRFIYGTEITSATLVSGFTRVFSTPYAGSINSTFWLWQHDIEDEDTVIDIDKREPVHNGRRTRLPSTRVYPASTIDEIENNTDNLMWFLSGGVLYFSKVTGSELMDNPVIIPDRVSIRASKSRHVSIDNLGIFYKPLVTSGLTGEISNLVVGMVNASGAIITDKTVGLTLNNPEAFGCMNDGINGHVSGNTGNPYKYANQLKITINNAYCHDNGDDGESHHEFCEVVVNGGLYEYNGNGGTPASGAHVTYNMVTAQYNGSHKWSEGQEGTSFSSQGSSLDGGIGTSIKCNSCLSMNNDGGYKGRDPDSRFINCVSIGDGVPFSGGQQINCVTI